MVVRACNLALGRQRKQEHHKPEEISLAHTQMAWTMLTVQTGNKNEATHFRYANKMCLPL